MSWNRCVLALATAVALATGPATAGPGRGLDHARTEGGGAPRRSRSPRRAARTRSRSSRRARWWSRASASATSPLLSQIIHDELHRCGGFASHASRDEAFQAVARELALVPRRGARRLHDRQRPGGAGADRAACRRRTSAPPSPRWPRSSPATTRPRPGWTPPTGSATSGRASRRAGRTSRSSSSPTRRATTPQPSVILTIPGTTLPSEVVVLGAHQDSINGGSHRPRARAPTTTRPASPASRRSSGSRSRNGYRPLRTVKFMAYAAEEVGLRGSADIAAQHRNANANVVGVLQLDMTNYKGTPTVDFALVTDHTNAGPEHVRGRSSSTPTSACPRVNTPVRLRLLGPRVVEHAGLRRVLPVRGAARPSSTRSSTPRTTRWRRAATTRTTRSSSRSWPAPTSRSWRRAGSAAAATSRPPRTPAPTSRCWRAPRSRSRAAAAIPTAGPVPLTYAWSQVAGPSVTIDEPDPGDGQRHARDGGRLRLPPDRRATAPPPRPTTSRSPSRGRRRHRRVRRGAAGAEVRGRRRRRATRAPRCVLGRDGRGPEPNQPNTINDSCADGTSGTFHVDESNDRIRVSPRTGRASRPARPCASRRPSGPGRRRAQDSADFFYAADATSPVWTFIGHRQADGGRRADAVARPTRCRPARCRPCACSTATRAARPPARPAGTTTATTSSFAVTSAPVTTVYSDNFETATGWTVNPNGTDTATAGALGARRSGGDDRQRRQAARHHRQRDERPRDRAAGRRQRRRPTTSTAASPPSSRRRSRCRRRAA